MDHHIETQDKWKYWQPVFKTDDLTVSGIISNHKVTHFEDAFPSGKCNLMASSEDGKLIFLTSNYCINVYKSAEFSSKNPPEPSTFFPFNPYKILRPAPQSRTVVAFNHIRSGRINKHQEILVAVSENGVILVWDIQNLDIEPVTLENPDDLESTWGIAICKNYPLIATSSNSHSVTIFNYPSNQIIYSFTAAEGSETKVHRHNIPSLDFSPCGRWLTSCSIDSSVALWSISEGAIVTKMKLDSFKEWGWLVRFVSPNQYDSGAISRKVTKTFYHSTVEEAPPVAPDEDFDEELYRNTRFTLERLGPNLLELLNFNDEDGYEVSEDDQSEFDSDYSDYSGYSEESYSEADPVESPNKLVRLTYSDTDSLPIESLRLFPVTEGSGHLAEGAGDTWPEGDNDDLGYAPYKSEEDNFSDYSSSDFSDMDEYDSEEIFTELENDSNTEPTTETLSETGSDSISDYSNSPSEFNRSLINVKFRNTENISFPRNQPQTCPYDIFYCTAESMFIIESSTGRIKLAIPRLIQKCFDNQNEDGSSADTNGNFLSMNFLQNRLAMGEWIPELSVFLLIDCNGRFVIISPSINSNRLDYSSIMLPDVLYIPSHQQVIGYTVIRREDEEFGVKVHVYLIYEDGAFRLYEMTKRIK